MYTANQTIEHVQPRLRAIVEHQKKKCGCAMQAVKRAASKIGASEHWVRRVLGRYGEVSIHAHHFLNILREHVRIKRAERRKLKVGHLWPRKSRTIFTPENSSVAR